MGGCILGTCPVCGELIWEDDWECAILPKSGIDTITHELCAEFIRRDPEIAALLIERSEEYDDMLDVKNCTIERLKREIENLQARLKLLMLQRELGVAP